MEYIYGQMVSGFSYWWCLSKFRTIRTYVHTHVRIGSYSTAHRDQELAPAQTLLKFQMHDSRSLHAWVSSKKSQHTREMKQSLFDFHDIYIYIYICISAAKNKKEEVFGILWEIARLQTSRNNKNEIFSYGYFNKSTKIPLKNVMTKF